MIRIVLKPHAFVLAWFTDEAKGQSYFIHYTKVSFITFPYVFNKNEKKQQKTNKQKKDKSIRAKAKILILLMFCLLLKIER